MHRQHNGCLKTPCSWKKPRSTAKQTMTAMAAASRPWPSRAEAAVAADRVEPRGLLRLNVPLVFGIEPPDEIVQDMIRNLGDAGGYTDSKGLFAPRKAVVHYTQEKHIAGVSVDDVQRLALARIMYRDADVWILDEPTSSLDPEAEAAVFDRGLAELDRALAAHPNSASAWAQSFSTVGAKCSW